MSQSEREGDPVTRGRQFFESLSERLATSASARVVYGEPVEAQGKTILPVARVRYGFGGGFGFGQTPRDRSESSPQGEGMGGGGGVDVSPLGVVEISDAVTRFVPIDERKRILRAAGLAFAGGLALGALLNAGCRACKAGQR